MVQGSGSSVGWGASKKTDEITEAPFEFLPVHIFPSHVSHSFSNMFLNPSLFKEGRYLPLSQWSSMYRASFHQLKMKMLLALER